MSDSGLSNISFSFAGGGVWGLYQHILSSWAPLTSPFTVLSTVCDTCVSVVPTTMANKCIQFIFTGGQMVVQDQALFSCQFPVKWINNVAWYIQKTGRCNNMRTFYSLKICAEPKTAKSLPDHQKPSFIKATQLLKDTYKMSRDVSVNCSMLQPQ